MLLNELHILALDCQTTAANPDKGRLLEIGWVAGCAASRPENTNAQSYLIRLPLDVKIPSAVSRITGISEEDLHISVSESDAWRDLITTADALAAENHLDVCPTVIHFARFELPFLRRLHEIEAKGSPFPLQVICTHEIARRLLPELPRRGIRALAGYFGYAVPELKRSADHVLATLSIWKSLVALLEVRYRVISLPGLQQWLADTPCPGSVKRTFPMQTEVRRNLPHHPGIYRMRRANHDILYIGKAKSLRQRVSSYFRGGAAHPEHILEMLTQARDLDYTTTASALEAAVAESDEIKRHCPPYNVALRPVGRRLIYCTRDLVLTSRLCDDEFCVGPLPGSMSIDALSAFAFWLAQQMRLDGHTAEVIGNALFGYSTATQPDKACLQKGLDLFRSTYQDHLKHPSALRVVTSLGAHIWRSQAMQSACEALETEERATTQLNETATREKEWTPVDIAGVLEGMLMNTAHMLRRARWFHLLLTSNLAWATSEDLNTLAHLLVFEKGRVVDIAGLRPGDKIPTPRCRRGSGSKNRHEMDLATYDRMRVVTTELRRLVCEGRAVELHLTPKVCLTNCELKKCLRWV
jgi:DNA polymerase III subunit epsilon